MKLLIVALIRNEAADLVFFGFSTASHRKALPAGSQNTAPSHRIPCKFIWDQIPWSGAQKLKNTKSADSFLINATINSFS